MRKYVIVGLISCFLMFLLSVIAFAEDMTNLDFANLLVPQLKLQSKLPDNYASMPADKQFEVASGLLASAGITALVDKSYDGVISAGDAADVIYTLTTDPASIQTTSKANKINSLVRKGIMKRVAPDKILTTDEGKALVSSPQFVDNVAENFTKYVSTLAADELTPENLVFEQDDPGTGIKTEIIKVEPDITAPYTETASPTM